MNTHKLVKELMILSPHDDLRNEKNKVHRPLVRCEQQAMFVPKFHPELNPIEQVWVELKSMPRTTATTLFRLAEHSDTSIRKCFT